MTAETVGNATGVGAAASVSNVTHAVVGIVEAVGYANAVNNARTRVGKRYTLRGELVTAVSLAGIIRAA